MVIALDNRQLEHYFFALFAILLSAHLFGYSFEKLKMPRVVGEIAGGIILGPSFLGILFPSLYSYLFNAFSNEGQLIAVIYELGLVLLMFISGFEIQKSLSNKDNKLILTLMLCSTTIPLIVGWAIFSLYDFSFLIGTAKNILALQIVFTISVAITSIPVISKIFIDLELSNTRFAKVVLGTATVHDLILYGGLVIATGLLSNSKTSFSSIAILAGNTIIFFIVALTMIPAILKNVNSSRYNIIKKSSPLGYILIICILFAAISVAINVNIMFGAFLAGISVSLIPDGGSSSFDHEKLTVKNISMALFVPFYFAVVGLQIDLVHYFDIIFFIAFLIGSTIIEIFGVLVAAKISKLDLYSSLNLAITMNARGGPGIVLATTAFALGIINENFFVTLVMSAVITSLFAGWWLKSRVNKKEQLLSN